MNILTTKDLQNLLQISHKKAKALMRTDGFPAVKIGRDYRVTEEAFTEWMSSPKAVKLFARLHLHAVFQRIVVAG